MSRLKTRKSKERFARKRSSKAAFLAKTNTVRKTGYYVIQGVRRFSQTTFYILYNNAGGATPRDDRIMDMPLDEFDRAVALNLFGPFAGCRFAVPHMENHGAGSIINTASIRAMIGTPGADGYTAAKGGIVTLTRALTPQLGAEGHPCHAIVPSVCQ